MAGVSIAISSGACVLLWFLFNEISFGAAQFAAAVCLATSRAITIATFSDLGAKGERADLLYALVALTGIVAFAIAVPGLPFLNDVSDWSLFRRISNALDSIVGSFILGVACAGIVLIGAEHLETQIEHHILTLGTIVLGVGTALYLDIGAFLPMLMFASAEERL